MATPSGSASSPLHAAAEALAESDGGGISSSSSSSSPSAGHSVGAGAGAGAGAPAYDWTRVYRVAEAEAAAADKEGKQDKSGDRSFNDFVQGCSHDHSAVSPGLLRTPPITHTVARQRGQPP
jgi:hypothetical protein